MSSKKAWTPAQRKRLSAIRHPEQGVPKGFHLDAKGALKKLKDHFGEVPEALLAEDERAQARVLLTHISITWSVRSGRSFTAELFTPLFGLWVSRGGLDLAVDMILPDLDAPRPNALHDGDYLADWAGLRRYLFAAEEADYARARDRVAPAFEAALASEDYDQRRLRDALAFAFCRDGDWPDRALQAYLDAGGGPHNATSPHLEATLGACTDAVLVGRVLSQHSHPHWLNTWFLFDMVESLGPAFLDVVGPYSEARSGPDRKRIAQASGIAEALRA